MAGALEVHVERFGKELLELCASSFERIALLSCPTAATAAIITNLAFQLAELINIGGLDPEETIGAIRFALDSQPTRRPFDA